jgi:hypothetical protein
LAAHTRIDIGQVRFHLAELLVRDGKAQRLLARASASHSFRHIGNFLSAEKR